MAQRPGSLATVLGGPDGHLGSFFQVRRSLIVDSERSLPGGLVRHLWVSSLFQGRWAQRKNFRWRNLGKLLGWLTKSFSFECQLLCRLSLTLPDSVSWATEFSKWQRLHFIAAALELPLLCFIQRPFPTYLTSSFKSKGGLAWSWKFMSSEVYELSVPHSIHPLYCSQLSF